MDSDKLFVRKGDKLKIQGPPSYLLCDLRNDCNNFSVDGGIPQKMDGTQCIMHVAHDVMCTVHLLGVYLHPP